MARLPVYHSEHTGVNIARVSPRLDTSVIQAQQNLTGTLARGVDKAAELWARWQETVNKTEAFNGKTNVQERLRGILNEAQEYVPLDFTELKKKDEEFQKRIAEVVPSVARDFTNKDNADYFSALMAAEVDASRRSLGVEMRGKYKDFAMADLLSQEQGNHAMYVQTGNAAFLADQKANIDAVRDAGWLGEEDAAKRRNAVDSWKYDYAENMAYSNPQAALDNLSKFGISAKEKEKIKSIAEKVNKESNTLQNDEGMSKEDADKLASVREATNEMFKAKWDDDNKAISKNMDSLFEYRAALQTEYEAGNLKGSDYAKLHAKTVMPLLKKVDDYISLGVFNNTFDEAVERISELTELDEDNTAQKAYLYELIYFGLKDRGADLKASWDKNKQAVEEVVADVQNTFLTHKLKGTLPEEANATLIGTKVFNYKPEGGRESKGGEYKIMETKAGNRYKVYPDKDGKFTENSVKVRIQ